ncbi:MAG: PIN domain-containing protein [Hydrotalea sp.]|nr:PIN domain-containing protein [Hydrotalea sp.]
METSSQKIINELASLQSDTSSYLLNYSKITRRIFPSDSFISITGDYGFEPLQNEAIPIQDKLFKKFNHLAEIISILLVDSLERHIQEFDILKKKIIATISQNEYTWSKNIQEEIIVNNKNFDDIKKTLLNFYPNSIDEPILIPDTNALYSNPEIENWFFSDVDKFIIALTPSVLSDLDKHKIEHRNETVRNKANKLINKIKEYRRRGKLSESVTIVKDKISLFTIAVEPNFDKTLSWLDRENDDDRLIAETLEIIRKHGDRPVMLITSDINLQNKCEVADLAFVEPPEII